MIKRVSRFIKEYLHFSLVVLAILIAGPLALAGFTDASNFLLGGTALISTIPVVWNIIQLLMQNRYGVDILAATAIITSVLLGEYWAGIIIVVMLTGGKALEDYAEKRAKTELTSLLDRAPKKAHKIKGNSTIDISVKQVKVNDKILIKPGEVVPVDCVIIDGKFIESVRNGLPKFGFEICFNSSLRWDRWAFSRLESR